MQTESVNKLTSVVEQCHNVALATRDTIARIEGKGPVANGDAVEMLAGYGKLLRIIGGVTGNVLESEVGE